MKYDTQTGRHSVYSLQYHLVFCTKYRKNLLNERISNALKEQIDRIAEKKDIEVLNKETAGDHIHILFRAKPTTNLSKTVNSIKGATSRALRKDFPELKEKADSLWSPAYFLASTGEVTLDQLKEYVEGQNETQ